jgi:hypothetical protein
LCFYFNENSQNINAAVGKKIRYWRKHNWFRYYFKMPVCLKSYGEKKFSERIVCRGCRRIEINRVCAQFCLLFFSHAGKIVSNSTGYIHYTYHIPALEWFNDIVEKMGKMKIGVRTLCSVIVMIFLNEKTLCSYRHINKC